MFRDDPLLFKPGAWYLYTGFGWNLIALAMQEAAGIPFETYIKDHVLVPLHMQHTFPDMRDSMLRKAVFYSRNRKGLRPAFPVDNYYKLAAGGYLSTSDDIAKLGKAYLQGNFIPETIAAPFLTAQEAAGASTYYGIGWEVSFDHKNRPFYGHTGNGVGGYAFFRIYPAQQMVFSILVNVTAPGIDKEIRIITDRIIDAAAGKK
ncbi:MAG: beta-lactamase family protein, partial [Sinomicrobium sp.]|nr:beta-lactamase family protein [Sinomicrobium sp.]